MRGSYGNDSVIISRDPFVSEIEAQFIRIGKQILTEDGWQTTLGLFIFEESDQVNVFTDERDDIESEGWPFHFGDKVRTRLEPTADHEYQRKVWERKRRIRGRAERRAQQRLAMEAAGCPPWCVEHYDGTLGTDGSVGPAVRNHASDPETVACAHPWAGKPVEFEFWVERRDGPDDGAVETVGILHTSILKEDVELTPEAMLRLSARLSSLAHRALSYR